jgi:hypothetical protein
LSEILNALQHRVLKHFTAPGQWLAAQCLPGATEKTALSPTPFERNPEPAFLGDSAPPADQRTTINDSDSSIGTKSAINGDFQKTGTGSDDFHNFKSG